MAKIYRTAHFIVDEGTNLEGVPWAKGTVTFLDDAEVRIKKYDDDHPIFKLKGKKKMTTDELRNLIDPNSNSEEKILVILRDFKDLMDLNGNIAKMADPIFEIKSYDSKESLDDDDAEYFIISDTFLRETNDKDVPGGILTAADSTFILHLGKKVKQYFLIIINEKVMGGGGEPPGTGIEVPPPL